MLRSQERLPSLWPKNKTILAQCRSFREEGTVLYSAVVDAVSFEKLLEDCCSSCCLR